MKTLGDLIGRMQSKHWMLIAGFLTSTGMIISGLNSWHDLVKPAIVGGLMGQLAIQISTVFVGAPPKTTDPTK